MPRIAPSYGLTHRSNQSSFMRLHVWPSGVKVTLHHSISLPKSVSNLHFRKLKLKFLKETAFSSDMTQKLEGTAKAFSVIFLKINQLLMSIDPEHDVPGCFLFSNHPCPISLKTSYCVFHKLFSPFKELLYKTDLVPWFHLTN